MEANDVKNAADVITADTNIIEAVQTHPEIMQVFADYGLGCIGCMAARFETIGEGAGAHGLDVPSLIKDINECIKANAAK
jgi:hybrid cluster-associated redox disulfide protein